MRKISLAVLLCTIAASEAFAPVYPRTGRHGTNILKVLAAESETVTANTEVTIEDASGVESAPKFDSSKLTQDLIAKFKYRELQRELEELGLPTEGTTSQLRSRLRDVVVKDPNEDASSVTDGGTNGSSDEFETKSAESDLRKISVSFVDESDPDFEMKDLVREIKAKSSKGHWKAATRKLKKLARRFPDLKIGEDVYLVVLESCMANRLQGARASEPARKILEQLVESGYPIPELEGNYCVKNCLGDSGPMSLHQGFGGVDTAFAMLAALEQAKTPIQLDTYEKVIQALAKEGAIPDAVSVLKTAVLGKAETPSLETFASVAQAAAAKANEKNEEVVTKVLAYAKAAGYDLDKIASTQDGRTLLASGIIAAERSNNEALGLRLLTAASKSTIEDGTGDALVANSSSAAQRACTLIHKKAIIKAAESNNWKLAVKVLELMLSRDLRASSWLWRNVVTTCAKAEKSKKATGLLLDWIKLSEKGKADKPPLSVFNTVINACEICDEQELTLAVLDSMKQTHDTEGNMITFNIALKRLAKQGNYMACEGIIVGMLQAGIEPSVVSYTTAIASCVSSKVKQPALAYEWIRRMRSRRVFPNVLTYNTALAACLDGKLESSALASKLASEMIADVYSQLEDESTSTDEYTDVVPNSSTKMISRELMQQLKENWVAGDIAKSVARETIRVPLRQLVDFLKSEAAKEARAKAAERRKLDEDQAGSTSAAEVELDYSTAAASHRTAEV